MKKWRGLFEIVKFPIEVLFLAFLLCGIGNLLTNSIFGIVYLIDNDYVKMFAEVLMRIGQFIIVNFPLLFLLRIVTRKNGSSMTIMSAFVGYVAFLCTTMIVTRTDLTTTAYSSILGLSLSKSSIASYTGITLYPLQTGLIGIAVVAIGTLVAFTNSKKKSGYGLFSFISRDVGCVINVLLYSIAVGVLFAYGWPFVIMAVNKLISFISVDTTNPVNLTLYGILDSFFSTLNLGTLIRSPFWYNMNGGSWVGMTGTVATGDVAVWSAQILSGAIKGQAGRFITPYYILNIFAIPGMIWGMYSLETNPLHKPRMRMICIIATITSFISGTLLPIELMLFFLAPLLYMAHLACTGFLFGLLQGLHLYLGFNSSDTSSMTALVGTLPELITYVTNKDFQMTIVYLLIIGACILLVYFFMTRFYFTNLAVDLFRTGDQERLVTGVLKGLGDIENIKVLESNCFVLSASIYDANKLDTSRLKRLGASKIVETVTGFDIYFGATSTMIRKGIEKERRNVK